MEEQPKRISKRQREELLKRAGEIYSTIVSKHGPRSNGEGTNYQIAKLSGLPLGTVYDFLDGKRYPQIQQLEKIIKAVNMTLGEFFSLEDSVDPVAHGQTPKES